MIKILNSILDQNNSISQINQQNRLYHIDFSSSSIKIQIYDVIITPIESIEEIASDLTTYNILPSIKNIMDLFDTPITRFKNVLIGNSGQREITIEINLKSEGYNNIKIEKKILEYALNTDIPDSITDEEIERIRYNTEKYFIDRINRKNKFKYQVPSDDLLGILSYSTNTIRDAAESTVVLSTDATQWVTAI